MTETQSSEALEKLNQGIEESRRTMQRQTMELAQEYFGDSVESMERQIKEGRSTLEGLPDQLPGGQEESFQMLFQELMNAYSGIEDCLRQARNQVANLDTESLRLQGEVEASEAAFREARELEVDLTKVEGSGSEGRVLVEDVRAAEPVATDAARREAEKRGISLSDVEATGADGKIIVSDVVELADKNESEAQAEAAEAAEAVEVVEGGLPAAGWIEEVANGQVDQVAGEAAQEPARVTSAARRKAEELGVDLSQIEGSGAGGLVTLKDVSGFIR